MRKFIVLLFLVLGTGITQAQDRMIKTDNTVLTVKIFEIGEEVIKYKPYSNQDGPMFSINVSNVYKIILESGDEFEYNPLIEEEKPTPVTSLTALTGSSETPTKPEQSTSQQASQSGMSDIKMNELNTRKVFMSGLNFDLKNTENAGASDEDEPVVVVADIFTFNMLFPMSGTDSDADIESSHGIVVNVGLKYRLVDPPLGVSFVRSDTYIVDAGVGYGFNMKDNLRFYGTLNTAVYFTNTTSFYDDQPDQTVSESFPEDSGSLRLGAFWTPFGKSSGRFGFHAAFDSYFAEGAESGFLIGIAFK